MTTSCMILAVLFAFTSQLDACSCLFWNDNPEAKLVARTMDFPVSDEPHLWVNPRGMHHKSQLEDNGLQWESLYGNIAISSFYRKDFINFITDGMNEKGLGVHIQGLIATEYEKRDHRMGIHYGEWVQYLLDMCQTVQEAIDAHQHFQVVPITIEEFQWPIHLMMEDASGDSAIIEFIEGQMKVHHGPQHRVMTNDPVYEEQLKNLASAEKFKEILPTSVNRFLHASKRLKEMSEPRDLDEAIHLMKNTITQVFQNKEFIWNYKGEDHGIFTYWASILDLTHKVYYFFPTHQNEALRVNLAELNFSNDKSIEILNLTNPASSGERNTEFCSPYFGTN